MSLRIDQNFTAKLILSVILAFSTKLFAESGGGGHEKPAKAGHEKPADGGGGPGAEKNPEWVDLTNNLQVVRTKIKMKEDSIQKLIEEKAKTKNSNEAAKIVKQMAIDHKEMMKSISDYEEKRNLLHYRFPEAGITKERSYERIEGKSLEAIENQWSLENKIKSTVKNIKAKYGIKADKVEKENLKPSPKANEINPLTEPMVISK